jgi:hypothetical protein
VNTVINPWVQLEQRVFGPIKEQSNNHSHKTVYHDVPFVVFWVVTPSKSGRQAGRLDVQTTCSFRVEESSVGKVAHCYVEEVRENMRQGRQE